MTPSSTRHPATNILGAWLRRPSPNLPVFRFPDRARQRSSHQDLPDRLAFDRQPCPERQRPWSSSCVSYVVMDGANEQVIVTVFEYDGSGDCHRFDGAWHEDKPLARYVESLYDGGAVQWIDL